MDRPIFTERYPTVPVKIPKPRSHVDPTPTRILQHPIAERTTTYPEQKQTKNYGLTETKGPREKMEDAHTIVENFAQDRSFYAVYDGHGGRETADFAAQLLHRNLMANLTKGANDAQALHDAFLRTDEQIKRQRILHSGATAVVAYRHKDMLYVATLGDSEAVLNRGGRAVRLSEIQRANDPKEQERIRRLGGRVVQDRRGTWRINNVAVSRALGDIDTKPYISAVPSIKYIKLDKTDPFLILACDGLWDVIGHQEAVDISKRAQEPQHASQLLVEAALRKGSQDNITALVIKLIR